MPPVAATRVQIPSLGGHVPGGWSKVCKTVLGIDGGRAAKLADSLPLTIALAGSGAAMRERVAVQFAREGVNAVAQDDIRGEPCAAHPRAVGVELCPSCSERRACALCLAVESPAACASCRGKKQFWTRFKWLRVSVLVAILGAVLYSTYVVEWRLQSWTRPITIAIYPVIAEEKPGVETWTSSLRDSDFEDVARFLTREGHRHGIDHEKLAEIRVAAPIRTELPPDPPQDGSKAQIALWSLKLRWWNFRTRRANHLPSGDTEIYVLYREDSGGERTLDRSVAVEKMRVGLVNAFAGRENASWTSLAIAHEVLHTVGASDKYTGNGVPVFPEGYAEPDRHTSQRYCEVMAGTIVITERALHPARSVDECIVGEKTAREIGWIKAQ